jgi:hypothetical protein
MREYRLEVLANDSFDIRKEIEIRKKQKKVDKVGGTVLDGIGIGKLQLLLDCGVEYMVELRFILETYKEGLKHWNDPQHEWLTSQYDNVLDFIKTQSTPEKRRNAQQVYNLYNNEKLNRNQKGDHVLTDKLKRWLDLYFKVRHARVNTWVAYRHYMWQQYTKEVYIKW